MEHSRRLRISSISLALTVVTVAGTGRSIAGTNGDSLDPLPQGLEVKLALSALPPYLRFEATVYILNPVKGYSLERQGTNGFTCYVERTDYVREQYRNDLFIPECFDAEGTRTIVPVNLMLQNSELREN